jgi:DNA-binding MarR family transcriptional regulator
MAHNPESLEQLAAEVELAARALLTLSTRASLDMPASVSLTQLRALAAVEDIESCTLSALAEALLISISSASRLVDRVAAAGLLDRRQSETSRREITLRVTPRGKRLLRRHESSRRAVFADALREISPDEAAALLTGLRAVAEHMARTEASS